MITDRFPVHFSRKSVKSHNGVFLDFIAVIMYTFGYAFQAFAEGLTLEGNFWDMNSTDVSLFMIGTAFDTIEDVLLAPLQGIFVTSDLANFALDVIKLIFETREEEKANA